MATLRIMTYNILYGGVGREELIREIVRTINPDVAVFIEVREGASFEAIADAVGRNLVVAESPFSRERSAIVSRWPIVEFRLYGPRWAPRKWIEATVEPFGGPAVSVHGVHLVPHQAWLFELWRRWEIHWLLKHLRTRGVTPHVVAGDFNAVITGDRPLRSAAPVWVWAQWSLQAGIIPRWALKPLAEAGYTDCYRACNGHTDGFTVRSENPSARIDYVFAGPGLHGCLRSAGVMVTGGRPSDHLPLWADFEWPPGLR